MEIVTGFIISVILGLLGLIPAVILRFLFKAKFNKIKSAILMIPIALIALLCLFAGVYSLGYEIQNYSIVTLAIVCWGTFQLLYIENDFENLLPEKQNLKEKTEKFNNTRKTKLFDNKKVIAILLLLNILFSVSIFISCSIKINEISKKQEKFVEKYETDKYYETKQNYSLRKILYEHKILAFPPLEPVYLQLYENKYGILKED